VAYTVENLEEQYKNKSEDEYYLELQSALGSKEDAKEAYDEEGNFHCINWWCCECCPAFNPTYCI